jgi:hypothetical protein
MFLKKILLHSYKLSMADFVTYRFPFIEVAPTFDEILDFLRSADLEEEHPAIIFTRDILNNLKFDEEIIGGYCVFDVEELDVKKGILKINETELYLGRQVCGYIKGATQVALFICTAGDGFTRLTNKLNEQGDIMEAYILDAIGSLTVEKAMDKIQKLLKDVSGKSGLKVSNRYSPGYCNWPLSDQKALFQLIGENPTGIFLSDSCLMIPRKSISGIVGIGKNLRHHQYGCAICNNTTCIYRKILHEK